MDKIKLFEMFAGYGGASFALKKAQIPFECVGFSEVDKFAVQCYIQNHGDVTNYGDCTKINPEDLPDFDLLTGGFPCQSFSVAGKGLGELDTRGTLFNDIIRIAEVKQPKMILLENVKGLTMKRFKQTFEKILSELKRIGYIVGWKVLNSKNYGVPQNRERVWIVAIRKDSNIDFTFPRQEELNLFLKDILEDDVDEKYYLKKEQVDRLIERTEVKIPNIKEPLAFDIYNKKIKEDRISPTLTEPHHNSLRLVEKKFNRIQNDYCCSTLLSRDYKDPKLIQVNKPKHSNNRVYSENGICPTLNTMEGGNRQPFIQIKNATKQGFIEGYNGDGISLELPNSKTRRGRVQRNISPTLQCNDSKGVILENLTIRKLTPRECFRLMGFLNDEINLGGLSDSQRYKLAGNGWDINLVSKILSRIEVNEK